MGIGGLREQNCRNARQPANEHRRVLCVRCFVFNMFVFCLEIWQIITLPENYTLVCTL